VSGTHFIKEWSPAQYEKLQEYLLNTYKLKGDITIEMLVNSQIMKAKNSRANPRSLTYDEALEEVTADACEMMLRDSKAIEELAAQNKTLAEKIKEWIDDFVKAVQQAFRSVQAHSLEAQILEQYADEARTMQKMWDEALKNAVEARAAVGESSSERKEAKYSQKMGGYFPNIEVSSEDIKAFKIRDIYNISEVKNKVYSYLLNKYISTEGKMKPIKNIDTGMEIYIYRGGINETFGNAKAYKSLSQNMKITKLATMTSLAKLIKYGEVRAEEANNYHNPNSKVTYAYLTSPIIVDGKKYNVNIDIRKSDRGNKFYIHTIKIADGAPKQEIYSRTKLIEPSADTNISQSENSVNNIISENSGKHTKSFETDEEQVEFTKDDKTVKLSDRDNIDDNSVLQSNAKLSERDDTQQYQKRIAELEGIVSALKDEFKLTNHKADRNSIERIGRKKNKSLRPSRRLCKPPNWCRITSIRRF